MPTTTPSNGLETANQKQKSQLDSLAVGFVFTLFSQAFEDGNFTECEICFETSNEMRRIWIVASGLEDSAKTPPGYDGITIFAQAAQATHVEQANFDTFRLVSFETKPRGLRLVALVLPLSEQRELVRCPIGSSGWHGRRVAFVRRKCFEHFVSIVRIGHEGVIVQLYTVPLHVRNIDIAKQWPDITRERNLGHNVLLLRGNAECEICKQNIKTKLYLLGCASRGGDCTTKGN